MKGTITSLFMLLPLGLKRNSLNDNGFIDAYYYYETQKHYENCIFLLFKPKSIDLFIDFLQKEYERELLIDDLHIGDYVVLVYALPEKWENDFELIKKGLYSKTSKGFQELFPKVKKLMVNGLHRDELSLQYQIFKKTETLKEYWENKLNVKMDREYEYWEGWDKERETLKLEIYEEN